MKTIFLISSLLSATAFAQVNIDQALQIRNQKNIQTAPGMVVGRIDVEAAKKAAASVSGQVSIQFGKNESVKVNQAAEKSSGGVIVGSGTDGRKEKVVVVPPLRPNMSITVSARYGSLNSSSFFCARLKDSDPKKESNCAKTGTTLRILKAGTYLVYLMGANTLGLSPLEVSVNSGQNLIIPTREIQVGAHKELKEFLLYADYTSSAELGKLRSIGTRKLIEIYSDKKRYAFIGHSEETENYIISNIAGENFDTFLRNSRINDFGLLELTPNSIPMIGANKERPLHHVPLPAITIDTFIGEASTFRVRDGGFFNVLPGTYGIQWVFDNEQIDYTNNIVVE